MDRWAVRETGKFLRRNLQNDSTIGASDTARSRLAYYATRPIRPVPTDTAQLGSLDYLVLDRRDVLGIDPAAGPGPREVDFAGLRLRIVAQFGAWVLARVERA